MADLGSLHPHGEPPPGGPAAGAADPRRGRCGPVAAGTARPRRAAGLPADRRLRADREHDVHHLPSDLAGSRGPRLGAHRPSHWQHPGGDPRLFFAAGPGRGGGGALHRRPGSRPRLLRPPRADRPAFPSGRRLRALRRASLPDRRPRPLARRRDDRVPRPAGPSGQGAGLPHRAGGDRDRPRAPPGGVGERGGDARGPSGRPAAGGLRGPGGGPGAGAGRAFRLPPPGAAGAHDSGDLRDPGLDPALRQQQA